MAPLHPASAIAAAAHRDIETAHHGAPHNLFLMLRFVALKLHAAATMGALRRQRHGDRFIHARRDGAAGLPPIAPARFAARAFGLAFGLPRECGAAWRLLARNAASSSRDRYRLISGTDYCS